MMGWRARLGFLVPPGNPTVEPEVIAMAPPGVSVHFSRMVAHGPTGTLDGQEERNRSQIEHIGDSAGLLAMVKPNVIMLAHTATSYIYDETPERAYRLGRAVDRGNVQAVFLSGLSMPTVSILETLEHDLDKPAISAASAMMWQALRLAGVRQRIPGYGRLLALDAHHVEPRAMGFVTQSG
jgi:maleate isomerase